MKTFLTNFFILVFALLTLAAAMGLVFVVSVAIIAALGSVFGSILSILAGSIIGGLLFALFVWIMELIFE